MCYELIDLFSFSRFFQLSPVDATARFGLALRTLSGAAMSVAVLIYALLIDARGFAAGSVAYIGGGAVLIGAVSVGARLSFRAARREAVAPPVIR
jgi:hypothetical protein